MEKSEIIRSGKFCHWNKIRLENLIFYLADREASALKACSGSFQIKGRASCYLRSLVQIYNHFFTVENRRFLAQDLAVTYAAICGDYAAFTQEKKRNMPVPSFHLCPAKKSFSDKW